MFNNYFHANDIKKSQNFEYHFVVSTVSLNTQWRLVLRLLWKTNQ